MATPTALTYWRRRLTVLTALLLVVFAATALVGRITAEAGLEDRVAGHVVLEPGDRLWDVAAATAPEGTDVRAQLSRLRELNGFDGQPLEAWTVVRVPAR